MDPRDPSSTWRRMRNELLRDLWQVYHTDPTARACGQLISNRVLSAGVLVQLNKDQTLQEAYQKFTDVYWVDFMREAIDSLLVQGFVAYKLLEREDVDFRGFCPVVLTPSDGDFLTRTRPRTFETEYAFQRHGTLRPEEMEPAVCFHVMDKPTKEGFPTSCMRVYSRTHAFVCAAERHAAIADAARARPVILTVSSSDRTFDERELVTLENAASGFPRMAMARNNLSARNQLNVETFKLQSALVRAGEGSLDEALLYQNGERPINRDHTPFDPIVGTPVFHVPSSEGGHPSVPDLVPLPNDAAVAANVPTAHSREDLVQVLRFGREMCCLAFGLLPEAVIGANTNKVAASEEDYMESKIRNTTGKFFRALKLVFDQVHETTAVAGSPLSEAKLRFLGAQTPELMQRLTSQGVTRWKAYTDVLQSYYFLTEDQIENRKRRPYLLDEQSPSQNEFAPQR